jgi:hypothetical protein
MMASEAYVTGVLDPKTGIQERLDRILKDASDAEKVREIYRLFTLKADILTGPSIQDKYLRITKMLTLTQKELERAHTASPADIEQRKAVLRTQMALQKIYQTALEKADTEKIGLPQTILRADQNRKLLAVKGQLQYPIAIHNDAILCNGSLAKTFEEHGINTLILVRGGNRTRIPL